MNVDAESYILTMRKKYADALASANIRQSSAMFGVEYQAVALAYLPDFS